MRLRMVKKEDWDYILKLRNNKKIRSNFYNQHTISKKEHYSYLEKQEKNPKFFNFVICDNSKDVGYVRLLDNDVSIIVDTDYNHKGIGSKTLKLLELEAKKLGLKKLIGRVMVHNESSKRIFEKNNYFLKMHWYEKDI